MTLPFSPKRLAQGVIFLTLIVIGILATESGREALRGLFIQGGEQEQNAQVELSMADSTRGTRLARLEEDGELVGGEGFTLAVPLSWSIFNNARMVKGDGQAVSVGALSSTETFPSLEIGDVAIKMFEIEKLGREIEEIKSEQFMTLEQMHELMGIQEEKTQEGELLTIDDVFLSENEVTIGNFSGFTLDWGCVKSCFGFSQPPVIRAIMLHDEEKVWVFTIQTVYPLEPNDLLDQAQSVVETFQLQ